jgi:hypothetical protein
MTNYLESASNKRSINTSTPPLLMLSPTTKRDDWLESNTTH